MRTATSVTMFSAATNNYYRSRISVEDLKHTLPIFYEREVSIALSHTPSAAAAAGSPLAITTRSPLAAPGIELVRAGAAGGAGAAGAIAEAPSIGDPRIVALDLLSRNRFAEAFNLLNNHFEASQLSDSIMKFHLRGIAACEYAKVLPPVMRIERRITPTFLCYTRVDDIPVVDEAATKDAKTNMLKAAVADLELAFKLAFTLNPKIQSIIGTSVAICCNILGDYAKQASYAERAKELDLTNMDARTIDKAVQFQEFHTHVNVVNSTKVDVEARAEARATVTAGP